MVTITEPRVQISCQLYTKLYTNPIVRLLESGGEEKTGEENNEKGGGKFGGPGFYNPRAFFKPAVVR